MIRVNYFDEFVARRVAEFLGEKLPWHRRLWCLGSLLSLKEILEASEALQDSVLSGAAFSRLRKATLRQVGRDVGIGDRPRKTLLSNLLKSDIRNKSVEFLQLKAIIQEIERDYLASWSSAVASGRGNLDVERCARLVASHLLDVGFSPRFLYEWWKDFLTDASSYALSDILDAASQKIREPLRNFEALLVAEQAPRSRNHPMPPEWRDPTSTLEWLRSGGHDVRDLRIRGGILIRFSARDGWAAANAALETAERIIARVLLGTKRELHLHDRVWFRSDPEPYPLIRERRGVDIKSLDRENQLYAVSRSGQVDNALELVGVMDQGSPAPAIAGGWAALEAILVGPGHGDHRAVAAENAAFIVACSFPRAELTQLAHCHAQNATDALASRIVSATSNVERAELVAQAIEAGDPIVYRTRGNELALRRLQMIIQRPRETLTKTRTHVADALHRLYRQRNLTLHWGRVDALCLEASLRTSAPLVGAVLDRVAHAWFATGVQPLQLAARARTALATLGSSAGRPVFRLLD